MTPGKHFRALKNGLLKCNMCRTYTDFGVRDEALILVAQYIILQMYQDTGTFEFQVYHIIDLNIFTPRYYNKY